MSIFLVASIWAAYICYIGAGRMMIGYQDVLSLLVGLPKDMALQNTVDILYLDDKNLFMSFEAVHLLSIQTRDAFM